MLHYWDGSWFRRGSDLAFGLPHSAAIRIGDPSAEAEEAGEVSTVPGDEPVPPPLISCLMVTRGRAARAALSIECYRRQSHPRRELVIVDDDPGGPLARYVAALGDRRSAPPACRIAGRPRGSCATSRAPPPPGRK